MTTEEFITDSKPRSLSPEEIEAIRHTITPIEDVHSRSHLPQVSFPYHQTGEGRYARKKRRPAEHDHV